MYMCRCFYTSFAIQINMLMWHSIYGTELFLYVYIYIHVQFWESQNLTLILTLSYMSNPYSEVFEHDEMI